MPGHLEVNVSSLPVDDIFRTGCSDVVALDVRSRLLGGSECRRLITVKRLRSSFYKMSCDLKHVMMYYYYRRNRRRQRSWNHQYIERYII